MTYINTRQETNESFGLEDGRLVVDVLQQLLRIERTLPTVSFPDRRLIRIFLHLL